MGEGSHWGHRQRARDRITAMGLANMEEGEILEFLLFHAIPYKDTKDLAFALIDKFGTIFGVCNAPEEELMKVSQMTKNAVYFLKMLPQVIEVYVRDSSRKEEAGTAVRALKFLHQTVQGTEEVCYVLGLDKDDYVVTIKKISMGNRSSLSISPDDIIKACKENKIKKLIVAHNHPSGNADPSEQDYYGTLTLKRLVAKENIKFVDHYVISGMRAYSIENHILYHLDQIEEGDNHDEKY